MVVQSISNMASYVLALGKSHARGHISNGATNNAGTKSQGVLCLCVSLCLPMRLWPRGGNHEEGRGNPIKNDFGFPNILACFMPPTQATCAALSQLVPPMALGFDSQHCLCLRVCSGPSVCICML